MCKLDGVESLMEQVGMVKASPFSEDAVSEVGGLIASRTVDGSSGLVVEPVMLAPVQGNAGQMAQLLDRLPVPAWILNQSGTYIQKNEHCGKLPACQMLGKSPGCTSSRIEEIGCGVEPMTHPVQKTWFALQQQVQETGSSCEKTIDLGRCGRWQVSLFPIDSAQGRQVGGMAVDVSQAERDRQRTQNFVEQLSGLARDSQQARVDERADVARDIHDHLGQEITVLGLTIGRLERDLAQHGGTQPNVSERFTAVTRQLAVVMQSAKRIAFDLQPDALQTQCLPRAAGTLVLDFRQRMGIRGTLEVSDNWVEPEADMAIHLYRSLQELLNNMAKHARASKFIVRLSLRDDHVYELDVTDDGVGLPPEIVAAHSTAGQPAAQGVPGRMGLRGLAERAAIYNGRVRVTSPPHVTGCRICIQLPGRVPANTNQGV